VTRNTIDSVLPIYHNGRPRQLWLGYSIQVEGAGASTDPSLRMSPVTSLNIFWD